MSFRAHLKKLFPLLLILLPSVILATPQETGTEASGREASQAPQAEGRADGATPEIAEREIAESETVDGAAEGEASHEETPTATAWNLSRSYHPDRRPNFSFDSQSVVFESARDGNWEIYRMSLDGRNQERLTYHPADDRSAAFSPDGKHIVFQSNRHDIDDRASDLYEMELATGEVTRLTESPGDDAFPQYSPDGKSIYYTGTGAGSADILRMDRATGEVETIVGHEANDAWARLSPEGDRMVFFSRRDGNDEIYLLDLGSGEVERLTDHPANDFVPSFVPGTNSILFASNRLGPGLSQLYIVDLGTRELRSFRYDGRITEPAVSPDGRYAAFVSNRVEFDEIFLLEVETAATFFKGENSESDGAAEPSDSGSGR